MFRSKNCRALWFLSVLQQHCRRVGTREAGQPLREADFVQRALGYCLSCFDCLKTSFSPTFIYFLGVAVPNSHLIQIRIREMYCFLVIKMSFTRMGWRCQQDSTPEGLDEHLPCLFCLLLAAGFLGFWLLYSSLLWVSVLPLPYKDTFFFSRS